MDYNDTPYNELNNDEKIIMDNLDNATRQDWIYENNRSLETRIADRVLRAKVTNDNKQYNARYVQEKQQQNLKPYFVQKMEGMNGSHHHDTPLTDIFGGNIVNIFIFMLVVVCIAQAIAYFSMSKKISKIERFYIRNTSQQFPTQDNNIYQIQAQNRQLTETVYLLQHQNNALLQQSHNKPVTENNTPSKHTLQPSDVYKTINS